MRIAPEIVARHWEAAAAEQLARDLEQEGYAVSEHERIGDHVASVVARRGNEVIAYGVKAPPWDERQANELVGLRDQVVKSLGGRFHLILVTPPRDVAAEVAGLDRILLERLSNPIPDELDILSSATRVDAVSDVEIASITVRPPKMEVVGNATVHVTLRWGSKDDLVEDRESFPIRYALTLDTQGKLVSVDHLEVDTTAWYGSEEESGELGESSPDASELDPQAPF